MNNSHSDELGPPNSNSTLRALAWIACRHGIEIGLDDLRRSFALPAGEPSTSLLLAMARELGLSARRMQVQSGDLPAISRAFPALIRLRSGESLVIDRAVADPQSGVVAFVRDPGSENAVPVGASKLRRLWNGELIVFKRDYTDADESRPFDLQWLIGQLLRERRLAIEISVAAIAVTVFVIAPPFMIRIIVDRVLGNQSMSTLKVITGAMLIMIVFEAILTFLRRRMIEVVAARVDGRLNLYVMDRLFKLPLSYFEQNPTGKITSKLNRLGQIRNFLTGQLFGTLLDMLPLLAILPILYYLDWRLASLVVVFSAIVGIIALLFAKPVAKRYSLVVRAEQKRTAHLVESLRGIGTIKALTLESRRRREWDTLTAVSGEARFHLGRLATYPQALSVPFERLAFIGPLSAGAYLAIASSGSVTAGALTAFVMLSMRVSQPMMRMARLQLEFAEARAAVSELATVMNQPPEDTREATGLRQPIQGALSFEDVRFRYAADGPYALDGLSFDVAPGTMLGVMGRSGSGKTTLTRLLQRLNSGYDGLIKVDSMDLREVNLRFLRANTGIVLQDNFLFSGTIRDNIAAARPDAPMSAVIHAAQLAGAEEFIERLPRGYETRLEEGAANLSGGQRQRLAIARALLTNPAILIFDEATSALDAESEAIVTANLRHIAKGRTVITISHRLSTLVSCDKILVLERGRKYDLGSHDELLERCDIYKQLWYQQNRHFERNLRPEPRTAIGQA